MQVTGQTSGGALAAAAQNGTALANAGNGGAEAAYQRDYKGGMTMQQAADKLGVGLNQLGGALKTWTYRADHEKIGLANSAVGWFSHVKNTYGADIMLRALQDPSVKMWKPMGAGNYVFGINSNFGTAVQKLVKGAGNVSDYAGGMTMQQAAEKLGVETNQLANALGVWNYPNGGKLGLSTKGFNYLMWIRNAAGPSAVLEAAQSRWMSLKPAGSGAGKYIMDVDDNASGAVRSLGYVVEDSYTNGMTLKEAATELGVKVEQLGTALRTWEIKSYDHEFIGMSVDTVKELKTVAKRFGSAGLLKGINDYRFLFEAPKSNSGDGFNVYSFRYDAFSNINRSASRA